MRSIFKFCWIHNVKDYDNVRIYECRNFCEIKKSYSIAEILMPKLEENASNWTFTLSDETLWDKVMNFCLNDGKFPQGKFCPTKVRSIRHYVIKLPNGIHLTHS